jgi:hypothetical protein
VSTAMSSPTRDEPSCRFTLRGDAYVCEPQRGRGCLNQSRHLPFFPNTSH